MSGSEPLLMSGSLLDGGIVTTVFDAANQISKKFGSIGSLPTTYGYDAAGNLASARLLPGVLAVTGVWDAENRPTLFGVYYGTPLGGPTNLSTSFVYNGDGQMVQKTDTAGVMRKFVWDAQNILQETDLADVTQVEYTLKPQLYGDLISHRRGAASRYYHCDAQGSVNALTDGAQSVQDIYVYDAWGNPVLAWENTENNFRYVGRQGYYRYTLGDPILFYQVRARHYGPNQWLSRDPDSCGAINEIPNLYVYANNDPTGFVDPSGLVAAWVVVCGVVLVAGGAYYVYRCYCTSAPPLVPPAPCVDNAGVVGSSKIPYRAYSLDDISACYSGCFRCNPGSVSNPTGKDGCCDWCYDFHKKLLKVNGKTEFAARACYGECTNNPIVPATFSC